MYKRLPSSAGLEQTINVGSVAGSGDDVQIRSETACIFDQFDGRFRVVQRNNQNFGVLDTSSAQDVRSGRIAKKPLVAKAPHNSDGFHVVIQNNGFETACLHQTVHNLTKPSDARNNNRAFFVDFVVWGLFHCFL